VWAKLWKTPQAAAWAGESWRWPTVGQYVRWSVRMEAADAPASLGAVVMRLADQIGMTPAGLRENGWQVAKDEVAAKRDEQAAAALASPSMVASSGPSAKQRMRAVTGDGTA
jgi:hypothetical protein